MKRIVLFFVMALSGAVALAQSYSDRFDAALNRDDYPAIRQVLSEWRADAPTDIDMLIASYNYYVNWVGSKAAEVTDGESLQDLSVYIDSGFAVIDQAIALYPDRLDLRFGKIYFLGVLRQWDAFANDIVATLDHSEQIEHRWSFPNMDGGMADVVVESVMDYQMTMFEAIEHMHTPTAADTAMMYRIRKVAKRTVQLFPSDIQSVNVLATTYTFFKDYDKAVKYLLRAEKMDPTDEVVLRNLADVYHLMGKESLSKHYRARLGQ